MGWEGEGLLCLIVKWSKTQGCFFFLRASQPNTGLRIILLTKPQFWLWPVKLKVSIILALCVFPADDSCDYDSPFLMYRKKVEAMQKGKAKKTWLTLYGKLKKIYFFNFFVLFPLFKFKHLQSLILPNQTKSHRGLVHISRCPQTWKFCACTEPKVLSMQYSLRKYFYFHSFSNLSSMMK